MTENMAPILSLSGLIMDILGFTLIGWNLLKKPNNRPMWSGSITRDLSGFGLVIGGFALQALAQIMILSN